MACTICASFVSDWLVRPMRNDELLYNLIHHRRLSHMIHEIIPMFNRFLQDISNMQIEMALLTMQIDIDMSDKTEPEEIYKIAWTSIGKWCRFVSDEFNMVEVLLKENCVFKDKGTESIDIWIGYCVCNLTCVKGVHQEHLQGKEVLLKKISGVSTKPDIFDELYN